MQVIIGRSGALTSLTVTCTDENEAVQVRKAFAACTSRFTSRPGLVVDVACKGREADAIRTRLDAMKSAQPAVAAVAQSRPLGYRHRVLRPAQSAAFTPRTAAVAGEMLTLTGHSKVFTGSELDGPLWGEPVCYAYYA